MIRCRERARVNLGPYLYIFILKPQTTRSVTVIQRRYQWHLCRLGEYALHGADETCQSCKAMSDMGETVSLLFAMSELGLYGSQLDCMVRTSQRFLQGYVHEALQQDGG